MRRIFIIFALSVLAAFPLPCSAQADPDVELEVRPGAIYVESVGGNIVAMERVFFHIVVGNVSKSTVHLQWVRFDAVNSTGAVFSGQYSGNALMDLFDSAIDRKRIEPTRKETLTIAPNERKAISDIFMDFPMGFLGEALLVQVDYKIGDRGAFAKISVPLKRVPGFAGRLPFEGVWYVAAEHGFLDAHKRYRAEAFAYDFLRIGPDGRSFQRDGSRNSDYYAYGKKVLAAKDGTVVFVRTDIVENIPSEQTNVNTPGGNLVVVDHGNNQYGHYAHLKPNSIAVRAGNRVKAGDPIAEVGNSGDSFEPHLHFHVMDHPDPMEADGVPIVFENWKAQSYGRVPIERRQGIIPKGEFVQP